MLKSFTEFLKEQWRVEQWETKRSGPRKSFINQTKIGDHNVRMDLNGSGENAEHFNVEYTVDNDLYKQKKIDSKTGDKIVKHVNRSLSSFIRHAKPKTIYLQSNLDRNITIHGMLAKRLAKKYGGEVVVGTTPMGSTFHRVIFQK